MIAHDGRAPYAVHRERTRGARRDLQRSMKAPLPCRVDQEEGVIVARHRLVEESVTTDGKDAWECVARHLSNLGLLT